MTTMRRLIDLIESAGDGGISEMARHTAPGKYGDLEVYDIRTRRDLNGLLKRFGGVRAMLHADHMMGWEESEFTHGDYEEHFGEGTNLRIRQTDDGYRVTLLPGIRPSVVRANPVFAAAFGSGRVEFEDAENYQSIPESGGRERVNEARLNGVALLFHSTYRSTALQIIAAGHIEPRTAASINGGKTNGVSLTRSEWFATAYNDAIFGFDAEALRRAFGGRLRPFADPELGISDDFHADYRREAEEFLMASLPLKPFLLGIWLARHPNEDVSPGDRHVAAIQRHPFYKGMLG